MQFVYQIKKLLSSPKVSPFVPKSISCLLEGYSFSYFRRDLLAGATVAILSLPFAMAFAIASGLDPERGLYTAIVAGFLSALFGGSRFLVSGPTSIYVVLLFTIGQKFGYEGIVYATLQASIILFLLGALKCGGLVRFIPYPVIIGFTSGIAITIICTQLKDFLGLELARTPIDTIDKIRLATAHISSANPYAVAIAVVSLSIVVACRLVSRRFPGVIVALAGATILTSLCGLPIETIYSKFGALPTSLPSPVWPEFSLDLLRKTFPDAVGIAILGAIESLLSSVVADSLTGSRHRSNCELIAQGIANFGSALCGGFASTGTIARTSSNIKMRAKTPFSGMIQATILLLLLTIIGPIVNSIPLAAIAGVLVYIAFTMIEFKQIKDLIKAWHAETAIMLSTFLITIFVGLSVAVQTGVILSIILFLKKSSESTTGRLLQAFQEEERRSNRETDQGGSWQMSLPENVKIYEIKGPLFFAVSDLLADIIKHFDIPPQTLIVRMRSVPFIDTTAVTALKRFNKQCRKKRISLLIAEPSKNVLDSLQQNNFFSYFPKERLFSSVEDAVNFSKS